MHLHILGVCGTFMGGIAALAKAAGHKVTGMDANVYPPMSTQLTELGIDLIEGYQPADLPKGIDVVVVGNAISRGNPALEHVLDQGVAYTSGPQWLAENVLQGRWVLAVAGTHGKTTTSGMLAWILEYAGMAPGFLIGGVPQNFDVSARKGESDFFVIEADEYDTAFCDKRSKFVHYRPRTCVLNNLEFDHADIFPDLAAIQRQFHHLVRTVPGNGAVLVNGECEPLAEVLDQGCWSGVQSFGMADTASGLNWELSPTKPDGSQFVVSCSGLGGSNDEVSVEWGLIGRHNMMNGLAAMAAARHVGVRLQVAADALAQFQNVKRRLELRGEVRGVRVYDDFAHHPTAITETLAGMRAHVGAGRVVAIVELRSNSMKMGAHAKALPASLVDADAVFIVGASDEVEAIFAAQTNAAAQKATLWRGSIAALVSELASNASAGDHLLVMSNGAFEGIHNQLLEALAA